MMLIEKSIKTVSEKQTVLAQWHALLRDQDALLAAPGAQYRVLLRRAHALHQSHVIDSDDLSDLLEQADGALAYAVETLLDDHHGE